MVNMDKGLTVPKWVLIVRPKIPQMPQNLSAQFVCPSPKVLDFNEKRLHWASVVRGKDLDNLDNILLYALRIFKALWRAGITEVVSESVYHVIVLKTRSLWVTLTSIPGLHTALQLWFIVFFCWTIIILFHLLILSFSYSLFFQGFIWSGSFFFGTFGRYYFIYFILFGLSHLHILLSGSSNQFRIGFEIQDS